jgi:cytochrome c oxidase subunit 2
MITNPHFAQLVQPPAAGSMAGRVDTLFLTLLAVAGLVLVTLGGVILVFLVRYRRGSDAPRPPLRIREWKFEAAWITATTVIFLGIFGWGASVYLELERPPANAMDLDVVARQWMWDVRQPNGRREFNTLHVPVGRPIRLRMTSEDVIHSLFVPAFRIKQDIVPGRRTDVWFEATRPGTYHLFCAQYCGTSHAAMIGEVVAQSPADYAAWLARGNISGTLAEQGRALLVRYGCSGCHTAGSTVHAPLFARKSGQLVPLSDGSFVSFDEAYIRDSILEPGKQIAAGYPNVMPSFRGVIPEGELLALTAYLKSLASDSPAATPAGSSTPEAKP